MRKRIFLSTDGLWHLRKLEKINYVKTKQLLTDSTEQGQSKENNSQNIAYNSNASKFKTHTHTNTDTKAKPKQNMYRYRGTRHPRAGKVCSESANSYYRISDSIRV